MARERMTPVRLTDEEHAEWLERANQEGISLSEWIRRRCSLTAGELVGAGDGTDPGTPGVRQRGMSGRQTEGDDQHSNGATAHTAVPPVSSSPAVRELFLGLRLVRRGPV